MSHKSLKSGECAAEISLYPSAVLMLCVRHPQLVADGDKCWVFMS